MNYAIEPSYILPKSIYHVLQHLRHSRATSIESIKRGAGLDPKATDESGQGTVVSSKR